MPVLYRDPHWAFVRDFAGSQMDLDFQRDLDLQKDLDVLSERDPDLHKDLAPEKKAAGCTD